MLTMIPNSIGYEYKSDAEKKVFSYLQQCSLDGVAFHSVGLPHHEVKAYSEADFIVVSSLGILCLEIKGGGVTCRDGLWYFENRYGGTTMKREGPFDQAVGAMYALRNALALSLPWTKQLPFACGVVFTDVEFTDRNVSVIPEILWDISTRGSFTDYMKRCYSYWNVKNKQRILSLNTDQIDKIRAAIRDDLHLVPPLGHILDGTDQHLIQLTNEQISLVECIEDNLRVLISGPAGSGKTLVAFHQAQRLAKVGKKVLFLTFNKYLAAFLRRNNIEKNMTVQHLHGMIAEYLPVDKDCASDTTYFSVTLPEAFAKHLSLNKAIRFDVLIVDEGQDLMSNRYLAIFDRLLPNGLRHGNWMIFYDLQQNLFSSKAEKVIEQIVKMYSPVQFKLVNNCRNTSTIAKYNQYISGISAGKTSTEGECVKYVGIKNGDVNTAIDSLLTELLKEGVARGDIIFLSPLRYENSVMSNYTGVFVNEINQFSGMDTSTIQFATIQAYKGLDSKVVVAIDLSSLQANSNTILYTLLSRARTLLFILDDAEYVEKLEIEVLKKIHASS